MSLTHQEVAQMVNDHLVEIAEENDCSIEAAIGGVALSTLILMQGADIEEISIGDHTITISQNQTQPTTK